MPTKVLYDPNVVFVSDLPSDCKAALDTVKFRKPGVQGCYLCVCSLHTSLTARGKIF